MGLTLFKLTATLIIFAMTIIAAWIPFKKRLQHHRGYEYPIGEAISSGVFLGAGLIHMLADSFDDFSAMDYHYPIAPLLAGITFLLLLFLEHIGMSYHHRSNHANMPIAILAVIMLSIHSFLAGAALGVSTSIPTMLIVFSAILAHKWAASFSLAVQINKAGASIKSSLTYFMVFACMTPMGILLGDYLSHIINYTRVLEASFNALAAGTFIYLGTLHGLERSVMIQQCCNIKEFLWMLFGFTIMALAAIWI